MLQTQIAPIGAGNDVYKFAQISDIQQFMQKADNEETLHVKISFKTQIQKNLQLLQNAVQQKKLYLSIDLSNSSFSDDDCNELAILFNMKNVYIYSLNLSFNQVTDENMSILAQCATFRQLLHLDISFTDVTTALIQFLQQQIKQQNIVLQLITLNITGTKIVESPIAQFIQQCSNLQKISAGCTQMRIQYMYDISVVLNRQKSIRSVDFCCQNAVDSSIPYGDCVQLLNGLVFNLFQISSLIEIDLSGLMIGDSGMEQIITALRPGSVCHYKLEKICLNDCGLTDRSLHNIQLLAQSVSSIKQLELRGNQFTSERLQQFFSTDNFQIKMRIDFRQNNIDEELGWTIQKKHDVQFYPPINKGIIKRKSNHYRTHYLKPFSNFDIDLISNINNHQFLVQKQQQIHEKDIEPLLNVIKTPTFNVIDSTPVRKSLNLRQSSRVTFQEQTPDMNKSKMINPEDNRINLMNVQGLVSQAEYYYDSQKTLKPVMTKMEALETVEDELSFDGENANENTTEFEDQFKSIAVQKPIPTAITNIKPEQMETFMSYQPDLQQNIVKETTFNISKPPQLPKQNNLQLSTFDNVQPTSSNQSNTVQTLPQNFASVAPQTQSANTSQPKLQQVNQSNQSQNPFAKQDIVSKPPLKITSDKSEMQEIVKPPSRKVSASKPLTQEELKKLPNPNRSIRPNLSQTSLSSTKSTKSVKKQVPTTIFNEKIKPKIAQKLRTQFEQLDELRYLIPIDIPSYFTQAQELEMLFDAEVLENNVYAAGEVVVNSEQLLVYGKTKYIFKIIELKMKIVQTKKEFELKIEGPSNLSLKFKKQWEPFAQAMTVQFQIAKDRNFTELPEQEFEDEQIEEQYED
ncbi:Conserved_hypothetical protein [Hexamita inflata]|uniref:Leucine Rich Repeat family protein n=1 Tax=Hexamita inflata TaxID=28002 RepID=A0AA86NYG1_9EUKA|nr:Conserved hypothetical protein [Hexamita inflata]